MDEDELVPYPTNLTHLGKTCLPTTVEHLVKMTAIPEDMLPDPHRPKPNPAPKPKAHYQTDSKGEVRYGRQK